MEEDDEKAELKAKLKTSLEHRNEVSERLRDSRRMEGIAYKRAKKTNEEIMALKNELDIINDAMDEILDVDGVYVESDELVGLEKERWHVILDKKIEYEAEIKELEHKKWMYDLVIERYKKKGNILRARENKMEDNYYTLRKIVNGDKSEKKSSRRKQVCKYLFLAGCITSLTAALALVLGYSLGIGVSYIPEVVILGAIFIGSAIILDTE